MIPTRWTQLRRLADSMSGAQIERDVWSLSEDARFPALLAVMDDVRKDRLTQGSAVNVAGDHGALAHCMGAIDAIDELQRRLEGMLTPKTLEEFEKK